MQELLQEKRIEGDICQESVMKKDFPQKKINPIKK